MSLAQLQRYWNRRLAEDGFRDVEHFPDHGETRTLIPSEEGRAVLGRQEVWRDMPEKARRAWALMAIIGWSVRLAARHVGVHHEIVRRWVRRVEERRNA